MAQGKKDPRITKHRVTMTSFVPTGNVDDEGRPEFFKHEAVDYVRPDFLEAYVADAKTRWQRVLTSPEPDAGPGGYHGATHVPATLSHDLAGSTFAATEED